MSVEKLYMYKSFTSKGHCSPKWQVKKRSERRGGEGKGFLLSVVVQSAMRFEPKKKIITTSAICKSNTNVQTYGESTDERQIRAFRSPAESREKESWCRAPSATDVSSPSLIATQPSSISSHLLCRSGLSQMKQKLESLRHGCRNLSYSSISAI